MTVGKCKDYSFSSKDGYSGSAGKTVQVKGYARGGPTRAPAAMPMPMPPQATKSPAMGAGPAPKPKQPPRARPALAAHLAAAPLAQPGVLPPQMKRGGKVKC